MSEFLPKEVREGLAAVGAGRKERRHRMRVRVGDQEFTILRQWDDGFSIQASDAPHVRGLVDLYDGARHVSQCLIVATSETAGEMNFEFKRATPCMDRPPVDYEIGADVPVARITHLT